jgi:hypothetical protein
MAGETTTFESELRDDDGERTTVSVEIRGNVELGLRQVRLFIDAQLGEPASQDAKGKRGRPVGTTNAEMERRRQERVGNGDLGRAYGDNVALYPSGRDLSSAFKSDTTFGP